MQSGKTDEPGTADESKGNTVEVTAPKEPEQAAPSEIAEGEESPLEKATNASASASPISAQVNLPDAPHSGSAAVATQVGGSHIPLFHKLLLALQQAALVHALSMHC